MARPKKWISDENAAWGLPPIRDYWRTINRENRQAQAEIRAARHARDKKRKKCRCEAYKFPHRPGGGLCRFPDPPAVRWQDRQAAEVEERIAKFAAMVGEPTPAQREELAKSHRPYRKRYAGLLRQIARANGLHPIRDRARIQAMLPQVLALAKQVKRQCPRIKFRNIEITDSGIKASWQSAGPKM